MSATEHVPLAEVKNRLSEVVDRLEREHGRVVITKHGRPAAVMLSLEDLESLEETLAILSDPSRSGRPLRFELEGMHSAHRGDYRVVYRIDDRRRRVEVLAIDHRADIYRRG
jgi:prevent-host-death family protein